MESDKEKPSEGTECKILVHLFETGSAAEFGQGIVTVSATKFVDTLRDAIFHEFPATLKDRCITQLVVKPTRDGAPLDPAMRLWRVKFEQDDEEEEVYHAYVVVPPKPEEGGNKRKIDEIYEMLQNLIAPSRRQPTLSMSELGKEGLTGARQLGFIEDPSKRAVLTVAQQQELAALTPERALTAGMTPFLEQIFQDRCVVNSEEFPWLGRPNLTKKLKPDFCVCAHAGVYEKHSTPDAKSPTVEALRSTQPPARFGTCYWDLIDSVFLGECKLKVENDGVGELLNKLSYLDTTELGNARMRGFIFDVEECWLIESIARRCAGYKRVPWTAGGSLNEIRDFFQWNQGWHAVARMCQELKVEIVQKDPDVKESRGPYLGKGARGRIFQVRCTDGHPGDHHALKVVQAKDKWSIEREYLRLQQDAARCPLLVRPTSRLAHIDGLFGYTMQPIGRSVRSLWDPNLIPDAMCSLRALHCCRLVHGDARLENLLSVNSSATPYVWVDVVGMEDIVSAASELNYRGDMAALVRSILRCVHLSEEMITLLGQYDPQKEATLEALITSVAAATTQLLG